LAGVEKVILPEKNKGDLSEVSEDIKKDLEIILVRDLQEALKLVV